jgi:hypothetical protein
MAALVSRSGTSCQPSASTSICNVAVTFITSLLTVAWLSISAIRAAIGGLYSSSRLAASRAAFHIRWNSS